MNFWEVESGRVMSAPARKAYPIERSCLLGKKYGNEQEGKAETMTVDEGGW